MATSSPGERPRGSTTAQLKADIDSGKTAAKVNVSDPGLSPLGTDDEAGGRPNDPQVVEMARVQERAGASEINAKKDAQTKSRVGLAAGMISALVIAGIGFVIYLSSL